MPATLLRSLALVAAVLVSAPAGAGAQDVATDGEVVLLEFGWAPGLEASVSMEQRILREGQSTDTDIRISTRYNMTVAEHPSGLVVSSTDGVLISMDSNVPLAPDNPLRLMYDGLSGIDQGYVLSPHGELLDVEGKEQAAAAFRAALAPVLDSASMVPEMQGLVQSFETMLTPDAMVASAAEFWNALVWTWAWEEYEVGIVYEVETEEPSPLMPNLMIPMRYELGFLEVVACPDAEESNGCVRLELRSYPDPAVIQEFMTTFMDQLGAADQGVELEIEEYEQENRIVLVTQPESLIPYSMEITKSIRGVMSENGETAEFNRLDSTALTFEYNLAR